MEIKKLNKEGIQLVINDVKTVILRIKVHISSHAHWGCEHSDVVSLFVKQLL